MANKAGLNNKPKCRKRKRCYTLPSGARVKCTKKEYDKLSWEDAKRTSARKNNG